MPIKSVLIRVHGVIHVGVCTCVAMLLCTQVNWRAEIECELGKMQQEALFSADNDKELVQKREDELK